MAKRNKRSKNGKAAGIGLVILLLIAAAYALREHWEWVAAGALAVAAIWAWLMIRRRRLAATMEEIDAMGGHEFETYLVKVFRKMGYRAKNVGAKGGDFGADLVVERGGVRTAVQAKNYDKGRVGNDAVQQAIAGATYYKCERAMVVTNSRFTRAAHEQAQGSEIIPVALWGRKELEEILRGREPGGNFK